MPNSLSRVRIRFLLTRADLTAPAHRVQTVFTKVSKAALGIGRHADARGHPRGTQSSSDCDHCRGASRRWPTAPGHARLTVHVVLLCGATAVLAFWWSGTSAAASATPGGALTSMGELAGLFAAYLVCAQLLLIGRVPWFERAVGMDRLVGWHRLLGTAVLLLVLTHVTLMIVGGALLDQQALWPEVLSLIATQPKLLSAVVGAGIFLVVGLSSARLARRVLSYEVWFALHLSMYVGIYLTFGHQIAAGTHFVDAPVARAVWIGLYGATASALVTWRVLVPLVAHSRMMLRVDQVVPEGAGMVSVWLRGSGLERLAARGGQFVLVRFLTPGHLWTAHPYSLSIVPTSNRLRVTVAALGDHSTNAARLRPGTRVLIEGPFGRFTVEQAWSSRTLLVAGGAGIGPIRALAEDLVRQGDGSDVVVHRAYTADGLALGREFSDSATLRYVALPGRRAELGHDPLDPQNLARLVPDIAEHRDRDGIGVPDALRSGPGVGDVHRDPDRRRPDAPVTKLAPRERADLGAVHPSARPGGALGPVRGDGHGLRCDPHVRGLPGIGPVGDRLGRLIRAWDGACHGHRGCRSISPDGSLDTNGVVKGWAAQHAAQVLVTHGVKSFCLNAGGDVLTRGGPEPGRPWSGGQASATRATHDRWWPSSNSAMGRSPRREPMSAAPTCGMGVPASLRARSSQRPLSPAT
jgi:predicted ferric reductase